MRTRLLVAAGLALALPAASFVPMVLAAPPAGGGSAASSAAPAAARPYDPRNQTNVSEYMVTCLQGNAKYLSRDFPGAIDTYRRAIQLDVRQPLAYYLLGESQLANGNVTEAEASWKQASLVATNEPALKGRVLFVLADLKERQKKFQEARVAWQAYNDWAAQYPNAAPPAGPTGDAGPDATVAAVTVQLDAGPGFGAFPASGAARIQAIDTMMKQDLAYDKVRRNIALSADGGLFSIVDGSPE